MRKKLSVAIPTYNRLSYLKECINSILNQSFQDFDIFVFDNASAQPVEKELKKFNDKRIHFIGSEKNKGSDNNFKRIYTYPFESKYLTIFHDDDLMHPKILKLQTSFLDANDDVIFVASGYKRVSDKNSNDFRKIEDDKIEYIIYKNSYEFIKAIMSWAKFAFDSIMYRNGIIGNTKGNFKKFSDLADQGFLVELSKKGPCSFINAPLINYRIHSGQDSRFPKKSYENGALEALSLYRRSLPALLNENDKKLFFKYSLNVLLYFYAQINGGFLDFLRYIKKCHKKKYLKYRYFRYIDSYGLTSLISIILRNRKIFDIARSFRNFFKKIDEKLFRK